MNFNFNKTTAKSAGIELITPELADIYLKRSNGNRNLKRPKIETLVGDMKAGNFNFNGESIIFSDQGVLLDGHHRLTSVIKSKTCIDSVVVRGVAERDGKTIDTGASRSTGDHLQLDGHKNTSRLASMTGVLLSLKIGSPKAANPSTTDVFNFISDHPEVLSAANKTATSVFPKINTMLGAIYFVAIKNGNVDRADDFRRVFASGIPDYDGCPAHLLRERLAREAMTNRRSTPRDVERLTVQAWEKFVVGTPARVLKPSNNFFLTGW